MLRRLRNFFFAGLLVIVPFGITMWILWWIFNIFDSWFRNLRRNYGFFDEYISKDYIYIPEYGFGFLLTVVLICMIGFFAQLYIGKKIIGMAELVFLKIPGISSIYNGLKQVSESLMGRNKRLFEAVALIEYPRKGIFALAFIISRDDGLIGHIVKQDVIYVFVPTTPNPTSGFYLILPEEDVVPLDISVEDAMKMIISSGMVSPKRINPIDFSEVENQLEKKQEEIIKKEKEIEMTLS